MSEKYIKHDTPEQAEEFLKNLKEEEKSLKKGQDGGAGSMYFIPTLKNPSFIFKVSMLNAKLSPIEDDKGNPIKVRASFFLNESGKTGEIYTLLNEHLKVLVTKTFPYKSYPNVTYLIQTQTQKKNSMGIPEDVDIEKPLGWFTLPYFVDQKEKDKNKKCHKERYGGPITLLVEKEKKTLTKPLFKEIARYWKKRAYVTCYLRLDNIILLSDKKIIVTISVNTIGTPFTVMPIEDASVENEEDIGDMLNFAKNNNIKLVDTSEENTIKFVGEPKEINIENTNQVPINKVINIEEFDPNKEIN